MLDALGAEDPQEDYRKAERRLRDALLGDGVYSAGLARGEEARALVTRELRKMRASLEQMESTVRDQEAALTAAATRIAALEKRVRALISGKGQKKAPRKAA